MARILGQGSGRSRSGALTLDFSRAPGNPPAEATSTTTATSVSTPAPPRNPQLDERSTKIMDWVGSMLDRVITQESLNEEKQSLKERRKTAEARALQGVLMSFTGDTQSAATILSQTGEEISKVDYLIGMIESDPEGYKQNKIASIFSQVGQSLQGAATMATAMYLPEAYATQRRGIDAQTSVARAQLAAGMGAAPQSRGGDDRAYVEILQMIMSRLTGKEQKKFVQLLKDTYTKGLN